MYVKESHNSPNKEKSPPTAEQTEEEKIFEDLKSRVQKSERPDDIECQWIRPRTWVLIN